MSTGVLGDSVVHLFRRDRAQSLEKSRQRVEDTSKVASELGYRETKEGILASSQMLASFQEQPKAGSFWALVQARNRLLKGI